MRFTLSLVICAFLFFSCADNSVELISNESKTAQGKVSMFVNFLTNEKPPTLAEYLRVTEESGERELLFEQFNCSKNGWGPNSSKCIAETRERAARAESVPSLYVHWLRERFQTFGRTSRLIATEQVDDKTRKSEFEIGNKRFVIYLKQTNRLPSGVVGVGSVNSRDIESYFPARIRSWIVE